MIKILSHDLPANRPLLYTLTVNASCNFTKRLVGIGMILQVTNKPKHRGEVLDIFEETYPFSQVSTKEMERFSIFRALQISAERGYHRVKIRSDCNSVRTQIKDDFKKGIILHDDELHSKILKLALDFEFVQFGFCSKRKNKITYKLARKAASIPLKSKVKKEENPGESWEFELATVIENSMEEIF